MPGLDAAANDHGQPDTAGLRIHSFVVLTYSTRLDLPDTGCPGVEAGLL